MRKPHWLYLIMALLLVGCDSVIDLVIPTETATSDVPVLFASPTIDISPPTLSVDGNRGFVGVNNPTAAAAASNSEVLPDVTAAPIVRPLLVELMMADGTALNAEFYVPLNLSPGVQTPGVLLMSTLFDEWGGFPVLLRDAGFTVLVVEPRIPAIESDFDLMLETLRNDPIVDGERVGVIGAEVGADIAFVGCAHSLYCKTAILLTPTNRQSLLNVMPDYNPRPLLIAANQDDTISAQTAEALRLAATGEAVLQAYENAGRGAQMLGNHPQAVSLIIQWLNRHLGGA